MGCRNFFPSCSFYFGFSKFSARNRYYFRAIKRMLHRIVSEQKQNPHSHTLEPVLSPPPQLARPVLGPGQPLARDRTRGHARPQTELECVSVAQARLWVWKRNPHPILDSAGKSLQPGALASCSVPFPADVTRSGFRRKHGASDRWRSVASLRDCEDVLLSCPCFEPGRGGAGRVDPQFAQQPPFPGALLSGQPRLTGVPGNSARSPWPGVAGGSGPAASLTRPANSLSIAHFLHL